jgi:hypothetical protein
MLSFHHRPSTNGDDRPPEPEALVKKVKKCLTVYAAESGDYLPMLGVLAPRKYTGWPHIHMLIQRHDRSETSPLANEKLLQTLGRLYFLKVSLSVHERKHNRERETDLIEYVSAHLDRHYADSFRPEFLAGSGVRTNFDKDRPQQPKNSDPNQSPHCAISLREIQGAPARTYSNDRGN